MDLAIECLGARIEGCVAQVQTRLRHGQTEWRTSAATSLDSACNFTVYDYRDKRTPGYQAEWFSCYPTDSQQMRVHRLAGQQNCAAFLVHCLPCT